MATIAEIEAAEKARRAKARKALNAAKAKAERELGRWAIEATSGDQKRPFDIAVAHARDVIGSALDSMTGDRHDAYDDYQ